MKTRGFVGLAVVVIVGLLLVGFIGLAVRALMLPPRAVERSLATAEGIIDKTLTADNAIYNYEWFKRQQEDIKASEKKILVADEAVASFEASAGPRSAWTFEDKNESARLRSVAQGLRTNREDIIAEYNARAKMANRSIFEDGKIPAFIEIGAEFLK